MNEPRELTVVIPCKNEENYIGGLLRSLARQTYDMKQAEIIVADAASTDRTREVVHQFSVVHPYLSVKVIEGGLPAEGRNRGAAHSTAKFVLFIDADVDLKDSGLIYRAIAKMNSKGLHCVTTDIRCRDAGPMDRLMYGVSNLAQRLSRLSKPYSTGMFMLFDRKRFEELGGFDEQVTYAEDYYLSMRVSPRRFAVVQGHIMTTNRRFKKSGYFRIGKLFLTTAFSTGHPEHFYRDHNYWLEPTHPRRSGQSRLSRLIGLEH